MEGGRGGVVFIFGLRESLPLRVISDYSSFFSQIIIYAFVIYLFICTKAGKKTCKHPRYIYPLTIRCGRKSSFVCVLLKAIRTQRFVSVRPSEALWEELEPFRNLTEEMSANFNLANGGLFLELGGNIPFIFPSIDFLVYHIRSPMEADARCRRRGNSGRPRLPFNSICPSAESRAALGGGPSRRSIGSE